MAAKQESKKVTKAEEVRGDEPAKSGEAAPKSAYPNGARDDTGAGVGRKATVQSEPKESFEERTGAGTPPWMMEDGTQRTGEGDVTEVAETE